ncbi:MAG: hypothetical protein RLZZ93_29 [Actinomycetota bacterium]
MQLSRVDRNRITVIAVVTAVVLPVAFMAGGAPADSADSTVAAATTTTYDVGLLTDTERDAPANVDGPVSNDPNGQGQIAYPADNDGKLLRGVASYRQFPLGTGRACMTGRVPLGAVITVRNLNNGRKTECTNLNLGYIPPTFDIVLNTSVFLELSELVNAPLKVELTW